MVQAVVLKLWSGESRERAKGYVEVSGASLDNVEHLKHSISDLIESGREYRAVFPTVGDNTLPRPLRERWKGPKGRSKKNGCVGVGVEEKRALGES